MDSTTRWLGSRGWVSGDVVFDFGAGDMLTVENTTILQLGNNIDIV